MALSENQKDCIRVEVGKGLSNRNVAAIAGCGEKAVRDLKKKENLQKDSLNALANQELANTIIANQIKTQKDSLKDSERLAYKEIYSTLSHSKGIFNNSAMKNQYLNDIAQSVLVDKIEANNGEAIEQLPNIMAIGKITESNRKQLLGATESFSEPTEDKDIGPHFNLTVSPQKE